MAELLLDQTTTFPFNVSTTMHILSSYDAALFNIIAIFKLRYEIINVYVATVFNGDNTKRTGNHSNQR